jgi:hypothetical protein
MWVDAPGEGKLAWLSDLLASIHLRHIFGSIDWFDRDARL